jgi:hypothetical protein
MCCDGVDMEWDGRGRVIEREGGEGGSRSGSNTFAVQLLGYPHRFCLSEISCLEQESASCDIDERALCGCLPGRAVGFPRASQPGCAKGALPAPEQSHLDRPLDARGVPPRPAASPEPGGHC